MRSYLIGANPCTDIVELSGTVVGSNRGAGAQDECLNIWWLVYDVNI